MKLLTIFRALALLLYSPVATAKKPLVWKGIRIIEEHRCSPYKRRDYPYSQSIEKKIVKSMGNRIYCPYSGKFFKSTRQTDIEHIVSLSEAHDSGLCAASAKTKKKFASDMMNLTLADPPTNRHRKKGHDAGEWMPQNNKCWYANKIIEVKRAYGLGIDRKEFVALKKTVSGCRSFAMRVLQKRKTTHASLAGPKVKKSKSGICHSTESSPHYAKTKNFTAYSSLKSCLNSGGRCPKRDTQCRARNPARRKASVDR